MRIIGTRRAAIVSFVIVLFAVPLLAQVEPLLAPELSTKIDEASRTVLTNTGVPSASVAVVKNGRIAYVQAYGDAKLDPKTPARSDMRYSIGSISKQFTAVAALLLQEQGKLSLDDKVAKYLPDLTRANEVSVRQLLSHTSGYQDYWPQDYVMPMMLESTTAQRILDVWGHKPLDFDPGTKWQYSNTNYVIAGVIIEKVSGKSVLDFLTEHVFTPLGMKSVYNSDEARLGPSDPTGYIRYALGPLHPAPKEGKGWMFAAGELAMTAEDLAKWDLAIIERKIMSAASYKEFEKETLLNNGLGTQYGLGVDVNSEGGHRALSHGGEVSGFVANDVVYPDDRAAIVVLTNQDAAPAAEQITRKISTLIFDTTDPATPAKLEQARNIFEGLQQGKIDRSLFTANCNAYFDEQAIKDFASSLGPLGKPADFTQTRQALRGGMTLRVYRVVFLTKTLRVWTYEMPDGKLEQYQVAVTQ
jgi:D-alanyl-D-alanine carboxypeptidase